ncbi:hypothetical protein ABIC10_007997 [Bradyrhizobium sp. S3.2.12]
MRAVLTPHVPFQFMDRRCLRSSHDVERNRLVGVAAKAADFEVAVTGIERIAELGRRLRWTLETEHARVPRRDGEPVGLLPRFGRAFCRRPDGRAVNPLA